MQLRYMIRYSYKSLQHKHDRIFSLLNTFSVTITILILVALAGLLESFQKYSRDFLEQFPLRIEIFKAKDILYKDLTEIEEKILALKGVKACYKRVPTTIAFVNADDIILSNNPRGSTILPEESLLLKDINDQEVGLLSKKQTNSRFDEIGIIASFDFLITLGYLPRTAKATKKETWQGKIPKRITMNLVERGKDRPKESRLPVPLVGVVANMPRDEYIITEDFYNIIMCWNPAFTYLLKDRHGEVLVKPETKIIRAYHILTEDQAIWIDENWGQSGRYLAILPESSKENIVWLDEHPELKQRYKNLLRIHLYYQLWEFGEDFEERLVIKPSSIAYLNPRQLQIVEKKLYAIPELKKLGTLKKDQEKIIIQNWEQFPLVGYKHQYIQAAVYAEERKFILPLLDELAKMNLVATSELKPYLKTFDRQEKFFRSSAIIIFVLIMFLAAIVLFSTFYANVQRKRKQIGILKASGASSRLIRRLYYFESLIIMVLGTIFGVFGGLEMGKLSTQWISKFVQLTAKEMQFYLPVTRIIPVVAIVFVFCWLAIFIPAQIAASTDPAQAVKN